jgi:hydrogenase expression/formation protein HypC
MCLGVPGKVIELYDAGGIKMAKVDFGGVVREACLEVVPEVEIGQYVIIHVGFAISVLDEEEAQKSLALLQELYDTDNLIEIDPDPQASS